MKYKPEQKVAALESIKEVGIAKTAEAMKISTQTLYKWRNESSEAQTAVAQQSDANTSAAEALLANDRIMEKTIARLEEEVKDLRAVNARIKAALMAVLEGGK